MRTLKILFLILIVAAVSSMGFTAPHEFEGEPSNTYVTVLGVAQDAGYPQINCEKSCCRDFHQGTETKKLVSSIGLIDLANEKKWLFDATPDIAQQIHDLKENHLDNGKVIDGIFLTHAHIGHYTGLMYLGHEAMGAKEIPVYAMPKMSEYLESNGPWSQLVNFKNIVLKALEDETEISLSDSVKITPFLVPHRDEYSETVGYKIEGPEKSLLFIPDINKWESWDKNIIEEVKKVDYALLDATFLKDGEINRPMVEVPHPFISETMALFQGESLETKSKIYFTHFNHTNPVLKDHTKAKDSIRKLGFNVAEEGMKLPL